MARTVVDSPAIERMEWGQFWQTFRRRYGPARRDDAQHVAIMGPTGSGKSTLAMQVAELRPYVAQIVEKPRDEPLRKALRRRHYVKVDRLPDAYGSRRVYVWPKAGDVDDKPRQRDQFRDVLRTAGRVGVWHTVVHETPYLVDELGLAPELKWLLRMGRSNGAGLILCAQRPAWLPRDIYSQSSHLFLFGTNDSVDLKAIGGLNGMDERRVRDAVANLAAAGDPHVFLYVGTRDSTLITSRAPRGLT